MKDSQKKNVKKQKRPASNNPAAYLTYWQALPVISLFIILLVLTVYNAMLKQQIAQTEVIPAAPAPIASYPFIKKHYAPDITAESAIIIDNTSKTILYEKNPSLRFSMASTTKIMTALTALEYYNDHSIIEVLNIHDEGVIMDFPVGEKILFKNMLYAMLLPSANDAAYAVADNYPGGMDSFVARMNAIAYELGLKYTHYADPAGLDDDGNYTTVKDLARLASYAMQNPDFTQIISTKRITISNAEGTQTYTLNNLNRLLGENGVVGIKTGFTQGAGEVLVTAKNEQNHLFIIVVMKSQDRFKDTETLISYINNNVNFFNPQEYLLNTKR